MLTAIRRAGLITAAVIVAVGTTPAHATPASKGAAKAFGDFTAAINFQTLATNPLPGERCKLTVEGTLTFTGTLEGSARGTTTATVFAPCDDVETAAPGTFRDIFRFHGTFIGTVNEAAVSAPLTYHGVTAAGGDIGAAIHLTGDHAQAYLRAKATVAEGGTYKGVTKTVRHKPLAAGIAL